MNSHTSPTLSTVSKLRWAATGVTLSLANQQELAADLNDESESLRTDPRVAGIAEAASRGALGGLHNGTLASIQEFQIVMRSVADGIEQSQREGRTPAPGNRPH